MPKRLSITFWATTFVVVVCLSLVGIDGWRSWNARVQRLADMERVTSNLARSMAQQADDTIKSADTSLTDIVERVETDGYGDAAMRRLHRLMVDQTANLPQLSGLFVYDENGRWMVNSRPGRDSPLNNADREYFLYHQSHTERGPHIGVPVVSRYRQVDHPGVASPEPQRRQFRRGRAGHHRYRLFQPFLPELRHRRAWCRGVVQR